MQAAAVVCCKQCTTGVQIVKKIGIGISGDAHKLQRDFGVQSAGLVCLSEEANARLCNWTNGRMPQKWSLAGQHLIPLCAITSVSHATSMIAVMPVSSP